MENRIIASMKYRRVLEFYYEGKPRTVNPHALLRKSPGNLVLHGWQTAGASKTRTPPCWGNFNLDKIVGLEITEEAFLGAEPGFNRKRFRDVIYSL